MNDGWLEDAVSTFAVAALACNYGQDGLMPAIFLSGFDLLVS